MRAKASAIAPSAGAARSRADGLRKVALILPDRSAPGPGSIPFMICGKKVVEEKGIEPSTPTLRTWCSPS